MENAAIFNDVVAIISNYCKDDSMLKAPERKMRFIEDLNIDSARLVDIVLDMEDKFGIEIEDNLVDKIVSIGDAVDLIAEKKK